MADLPTNYLDDILAVSMGGKRKFKITHANGSTEEVTIEDISEYAQIGSTFGAGDINATNQAVNEKFDSDDVVDPMLATESGYAADAKLTGDALSELNKNFAKLEWTLLQSVTGNSEEIILPEQFNELQVQMVGSEMTYVWNLYKHNLKSTDIRLIQGYAGTTNPNYASFYANNNRIKIDAFMEKNVSKTNSAVITVWYR